MHDKVALATGAVWLHVAPSVYFPTIDVSTDSFTPGFAASATTVGSIARTLASGDPFLVYPPSPWPAELLIGDENTVPASVEHCIIPGDPPIAVPVIATPFVLP